MNMPKQLLKIAVLVLLIFLSSSFQVSSVLNSPSAAVPNGISYFSLPGMSGGQTVKVKISLVSGVSTNTLDNMVISVLNDQMAFLSPPLIFPTMGAVTTDETQVVLPNTAGTYNIFFRREGTSSIYVFEAEVFVGGTSVGKYADIARNSFQKLIYFETPTVIEITFENVSPPTSFMVVVYSYDNDLLGPTGLVWFPGTVDGSHTFNDGSTVAGYAIILFIVDNPLDHVTMTYNTDPYPIPHASQFVDIFETFLIPTPSSSPTNLHQQLVIKAHKCGTKQFFSDPSCVDVDPNCDAFNSLSGECYTCINGQPAVQGSCQPTASLTVSCPSGTRQIGSKCVPFECSTVNSNGICNSCVSSAFVLNSNNVCSPVSCGVGAFFSVTLNTCSALPKNCLSVNPLSQKCDQCSNGFALNSNSLCASLCPSGQTMVGTQCFTLPPNCLSLNVILQCDKCESGFRISGGNCQPCAGPNPSFPCVECGPTEFVSSQGNCATQSQNCGAVDQATGLCLSCASGDIPVLGKCCPSGQSIQNGVCVALNAPLNVPSSASGIDFNAPEWRYCAIFEGGVCSQCIRGRSFNSGGICA